jgi:CRP-like cAMP-binding protein
LAAASAYDLRVARTGKPLKDVVAEFDWMRELPASARDLVLSNAYETHYTHGDHVFRTGDPAHSWIGVAEGLLKVSLVHRTGKIVMFTAIPVGSWMGEGSVVRRGVFRFDVIAMRDSRVVYLPGATFRRLLDESIEFNHIIISHLNERLAQYIAMMEIDRMTDPVARCARAISTLYNPVLYPQMAALLELSQSELGEMIGMSRQSIAAACKTLQNEGLIAAEYGRLTIRNLSALASYQERDLPRGRQTSP